jgi:hypothetical protein
MSPIAICAQYIRCGKHNCRCAGGALHGPYYYRFTREDGRLRKEYIRKADVEGAKASLELSKQMRPPRQRAGVKRESFSLLDSFLRYLGGVQRSQPPRNKSGQWTQDPGTGKPS